ncbi:MAG TPA: WbqC family protein [Candidatus Baltobacteraceae bacterium]|jgi:hypothetical protein|nr:WbqC family protein [Candidatus Baltobacteraceae bacterium]
MILSIMQPAYLPWLGYLHRLAISDVHVVLDSVPASKGDYCNRNRIRTAQGWTWLSVPLLGDRITTPICELQVDTKQQWAQRHWRSIEHAYRRAPYFDRYAATMRDALTSSVQGLESACMRALGPLLEAFEIRSAFAYSRDFGLSEKKSDLVLRICQETGASTYISGPLGRGYLDREAFDRAGIAVRFHDYVHPSYDQLYPGFEPNMCALDALFNCGPQARAVMERAQPEPATA